jgi:hypothetical protein
MNADLNAVMMQAQHGDVSRKNKSIRISVTANPQPAQVNGKRSRVFDQYDAMRGYSFSRASNG